MNGAEKETLSYGYDPSGGSSGSLYLGTRYDASYGFDGIIDEFAIHTEVLTPDGFAGLYKYPSTSNIEGLWSFDKGSGTTAHDFSENENDGTLEGDADWEDGINGKALALDGNGDCVTVPDDASLDTDITDGLTLEAWVYFPSSASTSYWGIIATKGTLYQIFRWQNKDTIGGYLKGITGGDGVDTGVPIERDVWIHLAMTYDGSHLKFYKNGNLIYDEGNLSGSIGDDTSLFVIAAYKDAGGIS